MTFRFNGAGVLRPRKLRAWSLPRRRKRCFNGAGVLRPRKCRLKRQEPPTPAMASMGPGS